MTSQGLKLIGKGWFSKVYRLDQKNVLIESSDYVKECLSEFGLGSYLFPELERLDYQIYKGKYYEKVSSLKTSLKPSHYKIYSELRKLRVSVCWKKRQFGLADAWREEFKKVSNKKVRQSLMDAVDSLGNYGQDVNFEISPRNVAVDNGKLVLLDVFFLDSQAKSIRT
jgi:hypothetical protein